MIQSLIPTGWPPQAYGVWTIAIMIAIYIFREIRETRKLSSADRQARREGYAHQVDSLTVENRSLRDDLFGLRIEYDDYRRMCQNETDQLRGQLIRVERELAAVHRRLDQQTLTEFHNLAEEASDRVRDAAQRVIQHIEDKDKNG